MRLKDVIEAALCLGCTEIVSTLFSTMLYHNQRHLPSHQNHEANRHVLFKQYPDSDNLF